MPIKKREKKKKPKSASKIENGIGCQLNADDACSSLVEVLIKRWHGICADKAMEESKCDIKPHYAFLLFFWPNINKEARSVFFIWKERRWIERVGRIEPSWSSVEELKKLASPVKDFYLGTFHLSEKEKERENPFVYDVCFLLPWYILEQIVTF